jgi:hypothetical protein
MTINPLETLFAHSSSVLESKSKKSNLFLDRHGEVADDPSRKASIVELYKLGLRHFAHAKAHADAWNGFRDNCVRILDVEAESKASFLFMRLMAPLGFSLVGREHQEKFNTLTVTSMWISEHCLQDMLMNLVFQIKSLERQIHDTQLELGPEISTFFLTDDKEEKKKALSELHNLKPKSIVGEILYAQLIGVPDDSSIAIPNYETDPPKLIKLSLRRISAFADSNVIGKLKIAYPDASEGLDEIFVYSNLIRRFAHLFFLIEQHKKSSQVVGSFIGSYFEEVGLTTFKGSGGMPKSMEVAIQFQSKFPFSLELYNQLLRSRMQNDAIRSSPGYSEWKFSSEIDLAPFEALFDRYFTTYRPFFLSQLEELTALNHATKRDILTAKHFVSTSKLCREITILDVKCQRIISKFKGPKCTDSLPNRISWLSYIGSIKQHIDNLFEAPSLLPSKGILKDLKRDLELSLPKPEPVVLAVACGGGGRDPLEALEPEVEAAVALEDPEFEDAKTIFRTPVKSHVTELYAEIRKKPLAFSYAQRVLDWFDNTGEVLAQEAYATMPEELQDKMVKIHSFSSVVDLFLNSDYSVKTVWKNRRTGKNEDLYRIAGMMSYGSVTLRGFFEFCIDPATGVCYHRCFSELDKDKRFGDSLMMPDLDFNLSFPTLQQSLVAKETRLKTSDGRFEVTRDFLGTISFEDTELGCHINLLKLTH